MSGVEMSMVEIPCQRDLSGASFGRGVQLFQFSTGRPSVWCPARSYLRYTVSVTGQAAGAAQDSLGRSTVPTISQGIALAESCIGNAYTNAYFLGGGATISQCTNFMAQASALEGRTTNSQGWLKSMGLGAYAWNGSFASRVAAISRGVALSDDTVANLIYSQTTGIPGFSQDEIKQSIYRPILVNGVAANANVSRVAGSTGADIAAVSVAIGGVLTNVNLSGANVTVADIGSAIVINGIPYTLVASAGAASVSVAPAPTVAILTTKNWYIIRREVSQAINNVDVLFRPTALGIFNYDGWLGAGDWQLNLTPNVNFASTILQTINNNVCAAAISDVKLYICTMKMSIPDEITTLHLREFMVQPRAYNAPNFVFSVPPSTEMLYVFLQQTDAGNTDTRYPPNLFITNNMTVAANPPNDLPIVSLANAQNNVEALQLTYANVTKPMTRWTSGYVAPAAIAAAPLPGAAQNKLVQFYAQHMQEIGKANDAAGVETFDEWLSRGALYSFSFIRDAADRSTEMQLQLTFGAGTAPTNGQVFICAEYRRVVEITQANGMITKVQSLNT